jgi:hypothetical protein
VEGGGRAGGMECRVGEYRGRESREKFSLIGIGLYFVYIKFVLKELCFFVLLFVYRTVMSITASGVSKNCPRKESHKTKLGAIVPLRAAADDITAPVSQP